MAIFSRLLVYAVLCVFAVSGSLRAEAVDFPKGEPAFSITFPETWKTSFTAKDRLIAQPKNGANVVCTVLPVEEVKDDAQARDVLPGFIEKFVSRNGIDFKALTVTDPLKDLETDKGITVYVEEWRGRNRKADEVVVTIGLFAAEAGDYYAVVFLASPEADKATENDQSAIVESISIEE